MSARVMSARVMSVRVMSVRVMSARVMSALVPALALLPLLVVVAAAAPPPRHVEVHLRCTEISEGDVSGTEDALEAVELAAGQRRYNLIMDPPTEYHCSAGAGVVVTACDVVPPQVTVAQDLATVAVLRLGPLWAPLLLEVTWHCTTTGNTTTTSTTTSTTSTTTTTRPKPKN